MASHSNLTEQQGIPTFKEHAKAVAQEVRASLGALLASVGANPTLPQEMARQFGLNKNLTWKISKIIAEYDPFAAIQHYPGKSGLKIFCNALEKAGAPSKIIRSVQDAFHRFDQMVEIHAGDRATLEIMLGNLVSHHSQQKDEALRKLSFRGNSAIWGTQARVQVTANFIAPCIENDNNVDLAWLSGLVDFRRLRQDVVWSMASARKYKDDGTPLPLGTIEPIDPEYELADTVPLLQEFCTNPLPEIRTVVNPDGMLRFELMEGPVGNTAATTCIIGLFGRNFVKRFRTEDDTIGEHIARLNTPTELLIHDMFVHRDLEYAFSPEILLYSQLPGGPTFPESGRDQGLLPVSERVFELGTGTAAVMTPEMPEYSKMVQRVYDRVGWKSNEFYGFRFKLRYPPIPSLAVLRYELPEKP